MNAQVTRIKEHVAALCHEERVILVVKGAVVSEHVRDYTPELLKRLGIHA
jgi:hypothetical protein